MPVLPLVATQKQKSLELMVITFSSCTLKDIPTDTKNSLLEMIFQSSKKEKMLQRKRMEVLSKAFPTSVILVL
jgi:hypothetical protein